MLDCFVYIRQDATQSYLEVLFYSIGAFNELQECSLITGETGKNFTDIVNEIRISKSIELLKNPKMRIADIAYSVGFNEPQYFSSIFKKCTNLTPRDYRDFYLSSVTERK